MRYGRFWAVQYGRERLLEIGMHFEPRGRSTNSGIRFGPYLDLHLPGVTISLGRNPIYAGEIELRNSASPGGIDADRH